MPEPERMTKQEWEDLEPLLVEAEKEAHEQYMKNPQARELVGDTERTPGYVLLQRLRETNDQTAIRLFRAVEMYHHEITRADITAAFLLGKEIARRSAGSDQSSQE
jgi:hypothetical protein